MNPTMPMARQPGLAAHGGGVRKVEIKLSFTEPVRVRVELINRIDWRDREYTGWLANSRPLDLARTSLPCGVMLKTSSGHMPLPLTCGFSGGFQVSSLNQTPI